MTREELIEKLEFYKDNKTKVHIDTFAGKYYNGLVLEVNERLIILLDRFLGEMPILLSEISNLEKYRSEKSDR